VVRAADMLAWRLSGSPQTDDSALWRIADD
jgi:hypothetical protein